VNNAEFDIGVCNIPGVDWQRPSKVNQDWAFIDHQSLLNTDDAATDADDDDDDGGRSKKMYTLIGVLDGHGKYGHELSSFAAKNMPCEVSNQLAASTVATSKELPELPEPILEFERQTIQTSGGFNCAEYKSTTTRTQQALINAFHTVHYNAIHDTTVKAGRNGATCIVCHIDHDTKECTVAYVGDSRAIRISTAGDVVDDDDHDADDGNDEESPRIEVIAEEHTATLPDERTRIENGEGTLRGNNVFYGPIGIAMTRALGDAVMVRAGVIPTPTVSKFQLNQGDVLVLATDGIWDVLGNERVRDIIVTLEPRQQQGGSGSTAQDAAEEIARVARERWMGDLPIMDEMKADDIMVLVVKC